jgi:hypothetical protein
MSLSTIYGYWLALVMLQVTNFGCNMVQGEESLRVEQQAPSVASSGDRAVINGYQHSSERSRFHLGSHIATRDENGWHRVIGTEGTFATRPRSGCTRAIADADSAALAAPPLTTDAVKHNDFTRAYFVAVGVPAAQIDTVGVYTHMLSGAESPTGMRTPARFVAYTSAMSRAIDGIPVIGSVAWARFTKNGETVDEGICWPDVPAAVVEEAKVLRDNLSHPVFSASLRSKLPTKNKEGRVVILHPSGASTEVPIFQISYDVTERDGRGVPVERHFDQNGREFRTPEEQQ